MKLLCFGIARDIIGEKTLELHKPNIQTVLDLKDYLVDAYPGFKQYKEFQIAINQDFAIDGDPLLDTDEIAIIPPVSGG